MSLQVERGLFKNDFRDYHAILGVPIDAEFKDIRKRYMKITRNLHPDVLRDRSDAERQQASEILSKLVNPAYEKLSKDKERVEHAAMLRLKGQEAARKGGLEGLGDSAQQLLKASDFEEPYKAAIEALSSQQYDALDAILSRIGEMSELNLAYISKKHASGSSSRPATSASSGSSTSAAQSGQSTSSPASTSGFSQRLSPVEQCYKRAEGYLEANNTAKAIIELRDAIKMEPNNAACYSLLGKIYLDQNQLTMARIHFDKALENDPKHEAAIQGKQQLEKLANKATAPKGTAQKAGQKPTGQKAKGGQAKDGKSGGFFGGLFGGGSGGKKK